MLDPRLRKLAQVLVRYAVAVREGDEVAVTGSPVGEPLAAALYQEILEAGGHPWIRLVPDVCRELFFRHASEAQLRHIATLDRHLVQKIDVTIGIWAGENTKSLSRVDPDRQAIASRARAPLMAQHMRRSALPEHDPKRLRWTGTVYPNQASAQDAQMSLLDYAAFVYGACKLDKKDPVAEWRRLGEAQQRLADRLARGREMHITTPDGTDIRFGIEGRGWINCDGHENFPDGEVFTGPVEDATEGVVRYSFPAVHGGREVNDIRLAFRAGRVVEASASSNEEFLVRMLDQDRGARCLGELALGTNYGIRDYTRNTLFDEKIGGTFHAALGAAYPESGGRNRSALHWDMVCDLRKGGVVRVDGEVVSRNGRFTNRAWPR